MKRTAYLLALVTLATWACVPPPELSRTCRFDAGPRAGQVQFFPQAAPIAVGSPCHDGAGSTGVAIVDGTIDETPDASGDALRFPVRGSWLVGQGPPCPNPQNHHCSTPNQQFALDLVMVDAFGQWQSCVGQPVVAPVSGRVIEAIDGFPDFPVADMHPAGNHVVIERSPSEFILLGHFTPGSLAVSVGQDVSVGQIVGACGSSGNSTFPHVHVHLQVDPNPIDFQSPGRPMTFGAVRLQGPSGCGPAADRMLNIGDVICP